MFFFDMIFSVIVKAVSDSETSFLVLLLFCLVLILPAFFSMVFYLVYGLVAITVSMMIPLFLTTLAEKINQPFANVVFFLSLLFFSRVVWMLISEKVYDFILKKMTGNRISIENNVIFDYRHTSEWLQLLRWFFWKMGYNFRNGITKVDEEQLYHLEKFR